MKKRIIIIVLLSIVGIYALVLAIGPFLAVILEPLSLKKQLDNPIIDQNYPGWCEVFLDEHIQIKLPEQWTIEFNEQILVYDEQGKIILRGEKFDANTEPEEKEVRMLQLLSDCTGKAVTAFSGESFGANRFANLASVSWLRIENGKKITSVVLRHSTSAVEEDYYYRFCFADTEGGYCDEAEAIAWSMVDH